MQSTASTNVGLTPLRRAELEESWHLKFAFVAGGGKLPTRTQHTSPSRLAGGTPISSYQERSS